MKAGRVALLLLALSLAPYLVVGLGFPSTGDQDSALHALYARFPSNPARILGSWTRPLFGTIYWLVAPAGYTAMRLLTVLICAFTGWCAYLLARRLSLPFAWAAVPLTLLQPCLFPIGSDTMTEPLFALTLSVATLALLYQRRTLAAFLFSLLPLARPEGFVIVAALGCVWLRHLRQDRRLGISIALLGSGMILWELSCIVVTGNWRYILDTWPWPPSGVYAQRGAVTYYLVEWPAIIGIAAFVPWIAGVRTCFRTFFLGPTFVIAVFLVHTALYSTGAFSSLGFHRYFATLAPLNGLIILAGLPLFGRRQALAIALLLPAQAVQSFIEFDSNPTTRYSWATIEALSQPCIEPAKRRVVCADHFGYLFLDRDKEELAAGSREDSLRAIDRFQPGTIVVWDNITGLWWYNLRIDDFESKGFRKLWSRRGTLESPLSSAYLLLGRWCRQEFEQAILVRE